MCSGSGHTVPPPRSYLRRRLGRGIAQTQFTVVSIAEGPNCHSVGRDDQSVVQATGHLRRRRRSQRWRFMLRHVAVTSLVRYLSNLVALQGRDLLRELLVGGVSQAQSAIVAVAKREKLPVGGDHGRMFEPTGHLVRTHTQSEERGSSNAAPPPTNLHHFLSLQGLDLSGSTLPVAVPVAQLPVVAVTPAEHLAALGQSHGVTVAAAGCHQLRHDEP